MRRRSSGVQRGPYAPATVRATLSGHSILGIAFAAIIYLVCLTGTLAVFEQQLARWEQPNAPRVEHASDRAVANAVDAAHARFGSGSRLYALLPDTGMPRLQVYRLDDEDETSVIADADGRLVTQAKRPWTDFLVGLHTQLRLPESWGRFVVGLAGVALLSSLLSGILAHPRIFKDAFHLRLGGSRRLQEADIHNRIGVWGLPFHLIVTLTGALLGLSTLIVGVLALLLFRGDTTRVYGLLSPPPAKVDARPAPVPNIAAMLATARRLVPDADPLSLTIDHLGRRDGRIVLSASRTRLIAAQDSFTFDATGTLVVRTRPADETVGARILGSLGPLHFGRFGGLVVELAYGVMGLGLCTLTASGINVWLARRRDKGRAVPLWERIWVAVAWGQPCALAATAIGSLLVSPEIGILTAIWTCVSAGSIAVAICAAGVSATAFGIHLRRGLGVLLVVLVLTHAITRRPVGDGSAIVLDMAMIGGGLAFLWAGGRELLNPLRRRMPRVG